MDGGLLNNFPIEPLEGKYDILIGSHVNGIRKEAFSKKRQGKINILEKCFHMAIASQIAAKANRCQVYIEPELQGFGMFEGKKADMIYEIGYNTALKYKPALLQLI